MCLAIPGQIESIDHDTNLAVVGVLGAKRKINTDLLIDETLVEGDWVLIHVGFAMSKISPEYAEEQLRVLEMLGDLDEAKAETEGYTFGSHGESQS